MRQLVYVSTAANVSDLDLEGILEAATRNNAGIGITGLLMFNGQNFLQVLEGAPEAIDALVDKVETDPRHSGLVVVSDLQVGERCFPNWSMRLLRLSASAEQRRSDLDAFLPPSLDPMVRRQMLNYAALN